MITEIIPQLYKIDVPLPENPLKNLNSYVAVGTERNLIVDTGFNRPECLAALRRGIAELDLDMAKTDFFITHLHSDHAGLQDQVASPRSKFYMNALDKEILDNFLRGGDSYWGILEKNLIAQGFPEAEMARSRACNPARIYMPARTFPNTPVREGTPIAIGGFTFTCIETPGHTPGHMCLYESKRKIMLLGDHVLFDITPNITAWRQLPNALAHYLRSLRKIKAYDVALPLPGHRAAAAGLSARVDELLAHHAARLADMLAIVDGQSGISGYEVAARMKWSIRAKGWDDFPVAQKWFAVGEALAHLEYLVREGRLRRTVQNGVCRYACVPGISRKIGAMR